MTDRADDEPADVPPASPLRAPASPAPARPAVNERARGEQAARTERLADALRANLRRRKDQQRARSADDEVD